MNSHFLYPAITAPVVFDHLGQRLLGDRRLTVGQLDAHHEPHLAPRAGFGDHWPRPVVLSVGPMPPLGNHAILVWKPHEEKKNIWWHCEFRRRPQDNCQKYD